jgi:hypothetical protein
VAIRVPCGTMGPSAGRRRGRFPGGLRSPEQSFHQAASQSLSLVANLIRKASECATKKVTGQGDLSRQAERW